MNGAANGNAEIVIGALLVIGREILSDRTKNRIIGFVAEYLTAIGTMIPPLSSASPRYGGLQLSEGAQAQARNECRDDRPDAR